MNDNRCEWERARFSYTSPAGITLGEVEGMRRGAFGLFDWRHNGIRWERIETDRISITHVLTGYRIGTARNGAIAMAIVDELMERNSAFSTITSKVPKASEHRGLRQFAAAAFKKHGGTFTAGGGA